VRRIIADCRGTLRWGGDYSGRPDPMHLEVVASEKLCAQALLRLTALPAASWPTIRRGDTGPAVQMIQRFLGVVSAGGPGYGTFGPATEEAVRRYQAMRGLEVDGVVGAATWRETGLSANAATASKSTTEATTSARS
jgi:peptidoglycan hydrolase-like protein with peptidoglycan-binding domain